MSYFKTKLEFNTDAPLNRQKGERRDAHRAFLDYYEMGEKRSLQKLLDRYNLQRNRAKDNEAIVLPPTTRLMTLAKWSKENAWQARLDAQRDIETAEKLAVWEQRRREHAEKEWQIATELFDRAKEMLRAPITEQRVAKDGKTVIVKPARWRASDITRFYEVANELARQALGIDEMRVAMQHAGEVKVDGELGFALPDFDELETEELEGIINAAELFSKYYKQSGGA